MKRIQDYENLPDGSIIVDIYYGTHATLYNFSYFKIDKEMRNNLIYEDFRAAKFKTIAPKIKIRIPVSTKINKSSMLYLLSEEEITTHVLYKII